MSIDNLDTTGSKGSGGSDTAHTITEQLERLKVVLSSAPEQNNISQTRQPRQPEEIMSPVIPLDGSGDHVSEERSGGFAAILRRQEEDEQHAAAAWAEKVRRYEVILPTEYTYVRPTARRPSPEWPLSDHQCQSADPGTEILALPCELHRWLRQ